MEYEVEGSRPRGRQRGHGERLCKKIAKHMMRMAGGWVFLLVPAELCMWELFGGNSTFNTI